MKTASLNALLVKFSPQFSLPLSISFHKHAILIFIYMQLLPEGYMGDAGNLPKTNVFPEMRWPWI